MKVIEFPARPATGARPITDVRLSGLWNLQQALHAKIQAAYEEICAGAPVLSESFTIDMDGEVAVLKKKRSA